MMNISFSRHTDPLLNTCTITNGRGTKAVIYPSLGASVQQLYFEEKTVINNIIITNTGPKLLNSSCSAILFPFANRINQGKYSYQNQHYQLVCNETSRGHAMHGLVYKESFDCLDTIQKKEEASVVYGYTYDSPSGGFPFSFTIKLTYTLKNESLALKVEVENIGQNPFPFSLGWHPYFYSSNLEKSKLFVDCNQRIKTNEQMIPVEIVQEQFPSPLTLENQSFDTGFVLNSPTITYETPDYQLKVAMGHEEGHQFVQLYTPSHRQSIAIEPMTAATDCYNNHWGMKELFPQKSYGTTWLIEANI